MNNELKPCPFCGGTDTGLYGTGNIRHAYAVCCPDCGIMTDHCSTTNEATETWNIRSPLTPDQVSQWLQDNGYEDMSKSIDCDFEI